MTLQVLITDYAWPDLDIEAGLLRDAGAVVVDGSTMSDVEMKSIVPSVDAILTCWRTVDAHTIGAAARCRVISRYGVGVDNIDVVAATDRGIPVTRVADYCVDEVAEHTMALLLASARKIPDFSRQTRNGGWDNKAAGAIHRLSGATLGLIGYGRIARAVATRARAFGLEVVAYAPGRSETSDGVRLVDSLFDVLPISDYLSVHVPLTDATRAMLGRAEFAMMKPTATIINTARGPIVDEQELVTALREGLIAGAALDVLDEEPPAPDHELRTFDTVMLTPHAAFYSEESTAELRVRATQSVINGLFGRLTDADSVVNFPLAGMAIP